MKIVTLEHKTKAELLEETCRVLSAGGLVVFPSDTVYGFVADATNESAVKKLIQFKNRPPGKAISVFVSDFKMIHDICEVSDTNLSMMNTLLPGPFTIVLPSKHKASTLLESERGTLGVRLTQYNLVTELAKQYGKPLTATSANVGGRSPHYSVESFLKQAPKQKQELVDLIVDAGKLPRNKPSTVIDLSRPEVKILRKGDILVGDSSTYTTATPGQTKKLAQYLLKKAISTAKGKEIVFVLKGDLGTGKTQFTKGIADMLGIEDVISPTFVIYYEYDIPESQEESGTYKRLYHFDLYNIEEESEFEHLGIDEIAQGNNIVCIEWGEKLGDQFEKFKKDAHVLLVELEHINPKERKITVSTVTK